MEANERHEPFEERHFTVRELASMWRRRSSFGRWSSTSRASPNGYANGQVDGAIAC